MLHPSLTMWCCESSSTCSSAPRRSRLTRKSGPAERSNGRAAPLRDELPLHLRLARLRGEMGRGPSPSAGSRRTARSPARAVPSPLPEDRPQRLVAPHDLAQRSAPARPRPARRAGAGRRGGCRRRSPAPAGPGTRAAPARTTAAAAPCAPAGTTGGSTGSSARRISSTRPAISATVGPSKSARSGSSTPNTSRTRDTTRVASSECPPSSKNSSSTPTPLDAQHLRPDPRQHLLHGGARRHVRLVLRREVRRRQRLAVQLAVGVHRERVHVDERGRDHVLRQPLRQVGAQRRRARPRHPRSRPPAAGRRPPRARAPPPPPRARPRARPAAPRSRPARSGTRAPSPARRRGP